MVHIADIQPNHCREALSGWVVLTLQELFPREFNKESYMHKNFHCPYHEHPQCFHPNFAQHHSPFPPPYYTNIVIREIREHYTSNAPF